MLKKLLISKISGLVVSFMLLTMLAPILAFAASIVVESVSYSNGKVTASVYTDVYDPSVTDNVYLEIYDANGKKVGVTTATYNNTLSKNGKWYYNVDYSVSLATYSNHVKAAVYDSVNTVTYSAYKDLYNGTSTTPPTCCSGGGGYYPPPTGSGTITVPYSGDVSAIEITNAFNGNVKVELKLIGSTALIPAAALAEAAKKEGATIVVSSDNGSYIIPLSAINFKDLATKTGSKLADMKIKVTITKVDNAPVKAAATSLGGTAVSNAIDFNVEAVGKDKTVAVSFGNTYVSRTITVNKALDSKTVTAVVYDPTSKKLSFVPATFETKDGKTTATIKRNSSSIYALVEFNKSFSDITNHWAKANIELLANKLVVEGVTEKAFQPERNITRAEFAALIVRSLSLPTVTSETYFKDVKSSDWFASVVSAAKATGIIDGYEDSTFRPDAQITREELAAMVVRALKFAGVSTELTTSQQAAALAKFKDSNRIVWAHKEMAIAIEKGIVDGVTNDTIQSYNQATRAQSATMLKRFLTKANFLD